jgi:ABC-type antimicrobial peptide transport system permease subunit
VHPLVRGGMLGFSGVLGVLALVTFLLASANVAGLLLARAVSQRRTMGIRLAVGASRGQLMIGVLTDSLLLSIGAGGAAFSSLQWLPALSARFAFPRTGRCSWSSGWTEG